MLIAGILVAAVVAFFEFWFNFRYNYKAKPVSYSDSSPGGIVLETTERTYIQPKRCFWIEIFEELRYASWCMNKQKRPELSRVRSKCKITSKPIK